MERTPKLSELYDKGYAGSLRKGNIRPSDEEVASLFKELRNRMGNLHSCKKWGKISKRQIAASEVAMVRIRAGKLSKALIAVYDFLDNFDCRKGVYRNHKISVSEWAVLNAILLAAGY